jgi:ribosomal protein L3 glutamine methyltransferase
MTSITLSSTSAKFVFPAHCPTELETIGDWWRFAVSCLNRADASYGQGTVDAEQDAAFLVLGAMSLPLTSLDEMRTFRLSLSEREGLFSMLKQRVVEHRPTAYVLGFTEQMGVRFLVDERVLIPRSYIGELLETQLSPWVADAEAELSILDLCTGSGCLAVLAADAFPDAEICAVDVSTDATAVAQSNLKMHGLDETIELFQGDLFAPLAGRKFDIILSNPPYVTDDSMRALPAEFRQEPALALAAGADGCDVLARMLADAPAHMNANGMIVVDIGHNRDLVEQRFPTLPFTWLATEGADAGVFVLSKEQLA